MGPVSDHTNMLLVGCLKPLTCRCVVGKSRHRAHTESQREESGESQFLGGWGPCGGPPCPECREAWMPIWGLSTESSCVEKKIKNVHTWGPAVCGAGPCTQLPRDDGKKPKGEVERVGGKSVSRSAKHTHWVKSRVCPYLLTPVSSVQKTRRPPLPRACCRRAAWPSFAISFAV